MVVGPLNNTCSLFAHFVSYQCCTSNLWHAVCDMNVAESPKLTLTFAMVQVKVSANKNGLRTRDYVHVVYDQHAMTPVTRGG